MAKGTSASTHSDGAIVDIDLSKEMRSSFLEYSYSVIYARALPDARDGLKPVQRRILFQMDRMGLRPEKPHVKCSRVVGDVMGRLHPHGDVAIYEALVRLAQPFTMRLPLVDGHGNFGSLDDGPAAPRYTESRLDHPALALTADIDEGTVDFSPNYDYTLQEPEVLPAAFPNLLVNGASGIAVGMATNMAPHNLVEVIGAARHLVTHPEASLEDLMAFVPGPDLPEGAMIVGLDGIRDAYRSGRGVFRTRASAHIENITARKKGIIVTQLPYLVGPERVIEKIKDAVGSKKLQGVTDVANLTDRNHGTRLVIGVKTGYNPEAVLAQLYKFTPLEESFGINNVALVDGQPRTLGLAQLLRVFVDHRLNVVRRRTQFRLDRRLERLHLVEGLLVAILDIDEVIAVVRSSDDSASARTRLMQVFDLSEAQANYILELQLRRLTKFSVIELEKERDELNKDIEQLRQILGSDERLRATVSLELKQISDRFGTPRRTILLEADGTPGPRSKATRSRAARVTPALTPGASVAELPLTIPDDPCQVVLSTGGLVARVSGSQPLSREGARQNSDAWVSTVGATARAQVGAVTDQGRLVKLDVVAVPELQRSDSLSLSGGTQISALVELADDEQVVGLVSLDETTQSQAPIFLASAQGVVKRVKPGDHPARGQAWEIISLSPTDRLVYASHAADTSSLVLITDDAQLLRFDAAKVRPQGRGAGGMAGIALHTGAKVIAAGVVPGEELGQSQVVTVAAAAAHSEAATGAVAETDSEMGTKGSVKVTPLDRFPSKGRATAGVRCQRFLAGEQALALAWVGLEPARALDSNGDPVALPDSDERRDGSGQALSETIVAIG